MDRRTLLMKRLVQQLEAIVELDNSLGVTYYNLESGLAGLEFEGSITAGERYRSVPEEGISDISIRSAKNSGQHNAVSPAGGADRRQVTEAGGAGDWLHGSAEKIRLISDLNARIEGCTGCVLSQGRRLAVSSEGLVDAQIAFVASAPGREEDNQGRNFQGAAGQLLTDIIEKGMKILRNQVYLTSIVKCRPPGNRRLFEIEIDACSSYFAEEMKIVAPKFIIAVGAEAANILTRQQSSIEQMRGIWSEYNGIPVMPIYHPSFLLRQRRKLGHSNEYVRQTWEDIKQVLGRLRG